MVAPACLPTAASTAEAAAPATPTLNPAGIQTGAGTATADGRRPHQDCDGQGTHHGAHRKLLSTTEILIPLVAGVVQESAPLLHECRPPNQ